MIRLVVRYEPGGSEESLNCEHLEGQSGAALYLRGTGRLRLVLVCDQCGAVQAELGVLDYQPHPSLPPPTGAEPPGLSGAGGSAGQ